MDRWTMLLAASFLGLAACQTTGGEGLPKAVNRSIDDLAIKPETRITVIYVGAWDCKYCTQWKAAAGRDWKTMPEFEQVDYREVETVTLKDTAYLPAWPDDLKWIVTSNAAYVKDTAPRFLILVDGVVVTNATGLGRWDNEVVPKVRALLKRRNGSAA
jgi:hypothetical protein